MKIQISFYDKSILQKVIDNGNYCPCSFIKNQDTKCMCKGFRDSIENATTPCNIICHCGLYIAKISNETD